MGTHAPWVPTLHGYPRSMGTHAPWVCLHEIGLSRSDNHWN